MRENRAIVRHFEATAAAADAADAAAGGGAAWEAAQARGALAEAEALVRGMDHWPLVLGKVGEAATRAADEGK